MFFSPLRNIIAVWPWLPAPRAQKHCANVQEMKAGSVNTERLEDLIPVIPFYCIPFEIFSPAYLHDGLLSVHTLDERSICWGPHEEALRLQLLMVWHRAAISSSDIWCFPRSQTSPASRFSTELRSKTSELNPAKRWNSPCVRPPPPSYFTLSCDFSSTAIRSSRVHQSGGWNVDDSLLSYISCLCIAPFLTLFF